MRVETFNSQPIIVGSNKRKQPFTRPRFKEDATLASRRGEYNDVMDPGFEDLGTVQDYLIAPGVMAHFNRGEPHKDYASMPELERL